MSETLPISRAKKYQRNIQKWRASDPAINRALEGDPIGPSPRFQLLQSEEYLQFTCGCDRPAWNECGQAKPKTFLANLWKQDLGELFIQSADSERYLEINLSPYAAWWACGFSEHRKADAFMKVPKPLHLAAKTEKKSWQSTLVLPMDYLEKMLSFGVGTKANVCFILGPADARRHFSWATLPVGPPDFHRVADFVPINLVD